MQDFQVPYETVASFSKETTEAKALARRKALAARPERCEECNADQDDHGGRGHTFRFRNEKEVSFD